MTEDNIGFFNYALGGGGLLSIITLLINYFIQRRKSKLENLEKETAVEGNATKNIQDAYNLFVKDYKDKTADLMQEIDNMEQKLKKLVGMNEDLQLKYAELSKSYTQLQTAYDTLKKDYETIVGKKYNSLKKEYNKIKKSKYENSRKI